MWAALLGLMLVCSTMVLGSGPASAVDRSAAPEGPGGERPPVEVEVEIAGAFDGDPLDAGGQDESRGDLGGDVARLALQGAGQVERRRAPPGRPARGGAASPGPGRARPRRARAITRPSSARTAVSTSAAWARSVACAAGDPIGRAEQRPWRPPCRATPSGGHASRARPAGSTRHRGRREAGIPLRYAKITLYGGQDGREG